MGLLGTSAQAFTDNFLKTYMAIGEDRRAEEAQKLAKQQLEQAKMVQEAQIRELQAQAAQREYAMQQDASMKSDMMNLPVTINQRGLMQSGIIDPKTRTSDPRALAQVVQGQRPQGLLGGELSQPTYQDQMGVFSKYNPEKAMELQATMATAAEARKSREQQAELDRQTRKEIAQNKNATTIIVGDKKALNNPASTALAKDRFKSLSKAETKAQDSIFKVEQYDKLIGDLGKGNVGGFSGGVKAFLAPVAESLGLDPDSQMGEAQAFKLMARALIGDMRLELVGSGPVSDAEQKLLSKLSGGDIASSRAAAKGLFEIYRNRAKASIKNYHSQYDLLKKRYPEIEDNFMRFDDVVNRSPETKQSPQIPQGAVPITNKRTGAKGYRIGNKIYDMNGQEIK